ncbi:MAG TPA: hypothetical protein V6D05_18595, partial [Stenomitos sp.]
MRRQLLAWSCVALMVGCAQAQPSTVPGAGAPVLSGRVGLPASFTNGIPFTTSTPFTNSTPAPMTTLAAQAATLAPSQALQVIDPTSGKVVLECQTTPEGRFSVTLPPDLKTAILQVVVRDTKGQIYGLVAMAT